MTDWKDSHKKVLSEYPRKIAHMRKQFQAGRFGLVLGSGVSRPLGVPDWKELNRLVAEDPEVQASECITEDASETIITQRIYEHYRAKKYVINSSSSPQDEIKQELTISRDFGQKLHEHLYSKHDLTENKRIKEIHTYLGCYLNILRNSNLTVNYNFDNYIERLLLEERTQEEKESSRGYETAVNINLPFRRDHRVVYHPNGFLPYEKMESRTNLVFSEKEFANQIIGVMTGHYSSLIHHFCNNTCLFIGISLNDPTLKHILKLVVRINPGRCHYFVHYYEIDKETITQECKDAIFAANFETYNLITLFLCDEEIAALGDLISEGYFAKDGEKDEAIEIYANTNNVRLKYW